MNMISMSMKNRNPSLDYLPSTVNSTRTSRIAGIATIANYTLLAPALLISLADVLCNPVVKHWITGLAFNECVGTAMICDIAGFSVAVVATIFKNEYAAAGLFLHPLLLLFLPSLMYA